MRTSFSGISAGTELTAYRGTNPYLNRAWDPDLRLFVEGTSGLRYPVAGLGYSEVGEIVEVAPDVDQTVLPVGAMVWGIWGHRSEAVLPAERFVGCVLPDGLDPVAATFARVGAVALNAVLAADVHLGEIVAVFGQGVLGLLATRLAQLSGARVVAVDTVPGRLDKASEYGAAATVDAAAGGVGAELRRLTDGRGADVAIEISGVLPGPARRDPRRRGRRPGRGRRLLPGRRRRAAARRRVPPQPGADRLLADRRACHRASPAVGTRHRLNHTFLQLVARPPGRPGSGWSATSSRWKRRRRRTACSTAVPKRLSRWC